MDYNEEIIGDIFYTGTHSFRIDRQLIVDICFLLDNDLLFVRKEEIASINSYHNYITEIKDAKIPVIDIEGGQIGHMSLKLIGRDYLARNGYKDINFEANFEGYKPDIITSNKKIIVECGNTNPDKIFNYFKNEDLQEVNIITYPDADVKNIYLYAFIPGDELADFLLFKDRHDLKNIKR